MKVSVLFQKKVSGSEPYSSEGYHVALETEPPPEIASDRQRLATYVMALAAEARARVEEALANGRVEQQEREPISAVRPAASPSRSAPRGVASPRTPPAGRPLRRTSARTGSGHANGNGNGEGASIKQVNYVRSLAAEAGFNDSQLGHLAHEVVGHSDLNALTKREASQMIDQLRGDGR
jgi:hypothetical protein